MAGLVNTQQYRRKMEFMEFFEEQGAVLRQMISSLRMETERSFSEVMRSSKSVSLGQQ
jgi:hypothetical protein